AQAHIEQLYSDARSEIENMKNEWENQSKQLYAQVEHEAFAEGFQKGEADAQHQYDSLLAEAQQFVEIARQNYDAYLSDAKEDVFEMSILIAEKVLHTTLENNHEMLNPLIEEGIERCQNKGNIRLSVNPVLYPTVSEWLPALQQLIRNDARISVYPTPNTPIGECSLETDYGKLDVSVEVQLAQIKEKLQEWLAYEKTESEDI
ncbi:MAG: FliH/SctL family protein, partial [Bacilli bacterium]